MLPLVSLMSRRCGACKKRLIRTARRLSSSMENDFIADEGLIEKEGRDVSQAKEMAKRLPALITYRSFFGELSTIDELIGFWPPSNRL